MPEGHPKAWVMRLVQGRNPRLPRRSLAWWSVHLERFPLFCGRCGPESSADPAAAVVAFHETLPRGARPARRSRAGRLARWPAHRRAELGYWVGVPYWGRGYGTEAARYSAPNPASGRVMGRLGMRPVGEWAGDVLKDGAFGALRVYGLIRPA